MSIFTYVGTIMVGLSNGTHDFGCGSYVKLFCDW